MIIQQGGKSRQVAVWLIQAVVQLKIRGSHLTCKVANKCLNVREGVEVEKRNKNGPLPFPAVL